MHQDDRTVMNLFLGDRQDRIDVFAFPVQGVYIPEYGKHGDRKFHILDPCAERRSYIRRVNSGSFIDSVICFFNFQSGLLRRDLVKLYMIQV